MALRLLILLMVAFLFCIALGGGLCNVRCSLHSRPKVCIRACGTSCARCKCVPPGLLQATDACGRCYTDMPTHHNKPKCP
ncbi:hypothetical protein I3842_05G143500 [Carya illinoinensis]|uniref:Gibberellin regulated protein n=1 Tax=Carya illinoinensis TaxID=32201 RepID=A0A922F2U4_CARIL|nr:hypothetical protein I3842_05G143500 [Carya illinoinensis]